MTQPGARALPAELGVTIPVLAAPMAGGPGTAALVIAAAGAGSLGFVAAGYKTPQALIDEIAEVRRATTTFGVNLFAPNPLPVDPDEFRSYAAAVQVAAERYGVQLATDEPREDDDWWREKVDVLLSDPVPVVSFTFGIPATSVIDALRRAGSYVIQTVTSAAEARRAEEVGVDALAVQSSAAGGHYGTLTPREAPSALSVDELVAQVCAGVELPVIAAGGISTSEHVGRVLQAGAAAVAVGTALLRTDESGATPSHQDALVDPARTSVVTRAFTGRPARGLRNDFIERYEPLAPFGYPALHHLTSPLRRAAVAAADPERTNLWAGTGHHAAQSGPAKAVLTELTRDI
jgi:nitronate monooxygenase